MEHIQEAIIINNEYRCPVCNRLHGKLNGNETVENLQIFCRGRTKKDGQHYFLLNVKRKENA